MLIGIIIISACLIIAIILDYKNNFFHAVMILVKNLLRIFRIHDMHPKPKEVFTFNGQRIYSREEVKEKMKLSYNKALEEIHHPLFDRDNWIEEDLKK